MVDMEDALTVPASFGSVRGWGAPDDRGSNSCPWPGPRTPFLNKRYSDNVTDVVSVFLGI